MIYHLAADAAEINGRITSRVTSTNNHHSLVSVAVWVSNQQNRIDISLVTRKML